MLTVAFKLVSIALLYVAITFILTGIATWQTMHQVPWGNLFYGTLTLLFAIGFLKAYDWVALACITNLSGVILITAAHIGFIDHFSINTHFLRYQTLPLAINLLLCLLVYANRSQLTHAGPGRKILGIVFFVMWFAMLCYTIANP